ncbi:PHP domain-containing protein [Sphingomonas sp. NIBR02145]|uniref:PHP domain-containing protein n=1 Tax=Sphingomonas sp. NIBR02145 TaxID=3014784 RepID=UPI0022B42E68|nr:PHP domain-containing protein [Sphingomonas sp. NIBR02145]WHU04390.1 PHP domain-containing protein [Sphingomonas sp. NIBR02145]
MSASRYVELQVTTHFSFLRGASSPEELFAAAAMLEMPALGIADRNSVAGIVRAWDAQRATGVRSIAGCRLDLADETGLLVYSTDRMAYGRLTRLLSVGKPSSEVSSEPVNRNPPSTVSTLMQSLSTGAASPCGNRMISIASSFPSWLDPLFTICSRSAMCIAMNAQPPSKIIAWPRVERRGMLPA